MKEFQTTTSKSRENNSEDDPLISNLMPLAQIPITTAIPTKETIIALSTRISSCVSALLNNYVPTSADVVYRDELDSRIQDVTADINAVSQRLNQTDGKLNTLSTKVENGFDGINQQITNITNDIVDISDKLNESNEKINHLSGKFDIISGAIDNVEQKADQANAAISALSTALSGKVDANADGQVADGLVVSTSIENEAVTIDKLAKFYWEAIPNTLTESQKQAFVQENPLAAENDYAVTVKDGSDNFLNVYVGSYHACSLLISQDGESATYYSGSSEAAFVWGPYDNTAAVKRKIVVNHTSDLTNDGEDGSSPYVTKAQADKGWLSEWVCDPATWNEKPIVIRYDNTLEQWKAGYMEDGSFVANVDLDPVYDPGAEAEVLSFSGGHVTATRHRVCAPVPTKPEDIGAQPAGNYVLKDSIVFEPGRGAFSAKQKQSSEDVNSADGEASFAGGAGSKALGKTAFAFGDHATAIGDSAYATGKNTFSGIYGWYYKYVDLTTGTFYLTTEQPDVRKISDMGPEPEVDTSFESGFAVGDVISYVNKNKRDLYATITEVNGNKIVVGQLNDAEYVLVEEHPNHDDWSIFVPEKPTIGDIWFGEASFAEGLETKAINAYTHTEGKGTLAYGQYGHAEGKKTRAAYASHAEGAETKADGQYSHAEGYLSKTEGSFSHAEGQETQALGKYAHAEGINTTASGEGSHSEGKDTVSSGNRSHAEGSSCLANAVNAHAEGYGSKANYESSHAEGHETIANSKFSHSEGYKTIAGDGTESGGWCSHAEGNTTTSSGQNSHSEGTYTIAKGIASHAEGAGTRNVQLIAEGNYSHAEGSFAYAKGNSSHSEGKGTKALNEAEHAEGTYNVSNTGTRHSIGIGTGESSRTNAVEVMQDGKVFITGVGGYDGTNPMTSGVKDVATVINERGVDDLVFEKGDSADSGQQKQTLTNPLVSGITNRAVSQASIVLGTSNVAGLKGYRYTNTGSVTNSLTFEVVPTGWEVGDVVSVVNNLKYSDCATIASISGTTVTFEGNLPFNTIIEESHWDSKVAYVLAKPHLGNVEMGYGAVAEGIGTKALNIGSHAEGRDTEATGEYSHAEGRQTVAYYASHAEGRQNKALNNYTHAEGQGNEVHGQFSHVEGRVNKVYGESAHAEGDTNLAIGNYSHAEGRYTTASGSYSHAESLGLRTVISVTFSGSGTTYTSNDSHGLKVNDIVAIKDAYDKVVRIIAVTSNSITLESPLSSTELIDATLVKLSGVAYGGASHVEGNQNKATGYGSHAEGALTTAIGNYSHAEGYSTTTDRNYSHAEGNCTQAKGNYSHAEGDETIAEADMSHAEGSSVIASGQRSHAEGSWTETKNRAEHAEGQFNKSNKASDTFGDPGNTLHSIGMSIPDASHQRMNAVEVMQDGKAFLLGVGGYDGTNPTASGVKDIATVINEGSSGGGSITQVNADWNATSGVAEILNKPAIPTKTSDLINDSLVSLSGDNSLSGKLTIDNGNVIQVNGTNVATAYRAGSITNKRGNGATQTYTFPTDHGGMFAMTSDVPTSTSSLINNGADGIHPYVTSADVSALVTTEQMTLIYNELINHINDLQRQILELSAYHTGQMALAANPHNSYAVSDKNSTSFTLENQTGPATISLSAYDLVDETNSNNN